MSLFLFFINIINQVLYRLPRGAQIALGNFLGVLWFDILRIRRNVILSNLRLAFPEMSEAQRAQVGRASCLNMGRSIVEYSWFSGLKTSDLNTHFHFLGEEHLKEALAKGRGVLLLSLHIGGGDLGGAALALKKYPIHVISKKFKQKKLNDWWFNLRSKMGIQFISAEKSSFDILKALKKREIVIFVLDQFMGPPVGVKTKFFGVETGTAAGLALFHERTEAPVILAYSLRRSDHQFDIAFGPEVELEKVGDRDQNIAHMTQKYTDAIEEVVRAHPEQWMWVHRRWKPF